MMNSLAFFFGIFQGKISEAGSHIVTEMQADKEQETLQPEISSACHSRLPKMVAERAVPPCDQEAAPQFHTSAVGLHIDPDDCSREVWSIRGSSPGRTRTYNPAVNSRMLYH